MTRLIIPSLTALFLIVNLNAQTIGVKTSKRKPAQSEYRCAKTDETIVVDGKLDERVWRHAPAMTFRGTVDGTVPFFISTGKIVWDDDYLYVGFDFESEDIHCEWAMKEAYLSPKLKEGVINWRGPWAHSECLIMQVDPCAKIFLDPDGDGSNYLEFHVNPANNVFDAWFKQGYVEGERKRRERFPRVDWTCPGLLTATHVAGTLNEPRDIDRGWSVEMGIPWQAIEPFTQGSCPPKPGDVWGAFTARTDKIESKGATWGWPVLEVGNPHFPDRFGKLVFEDDLPKFERFFAFHARCDEDFIKKAADMGVTDIAETPSRELIALCQKHGVNVYPLVSFKPEVWKTRFPDKKVPLQIMTPRQEQVLQNLNPAKKTNGQPKNWSVTEKQKRQIERLRQSDATLSSDYQWGGEPRRQYLDQTFNEEVLNRSLPCFHDPLVLEAMKRQIKAYMSYPGVAGIAFEGIGYQNYQDCHCPKSLRLYEDYCAENNALKNSETWKDFSFKTLVNFNNALADTVRELDPKAKTFNLIWPVYLPDPLYGNHLKIDFRGEVAAWFFFWDPLKIEIYSSIICGKRTFWSATTFSPYSTTVDRHGAPYSEKTNSENKRNHWPDSQGVAFIGYHDAARTKFLFPRKSPAKVESELRAILRGGSRLLMAGALTDIVDDPAVANVFKKFMRKSDSINENDHVQNTPQNP